MGRLLIAGTLASPELRLSAAIDRAETGVDAGEFVGSAACGVTITDLAETSLANTDVVVDFSLPAGTQDLMQRVTDQALVIGVTGLDDRTQALLRQHSERAPVVVASNFSTGINVLLGLVAQAAGMLRDYDLEIVEMHHNRKRDAPSGTARSLAEAAAQARGVDLQAHVLYGRQGDLGPRPSGQIAVHALRGGDIAGEHTVYLAGGGERLALSHLATSRQAFADGALRAAGWAVRQPPGFYSMRDVLGFKS
jgi:4-hydroxy-tetrahydrodipicolinate reductase